jgi:hypothetical protein
LFYTQCPDEKSAPGKCHEKRVKMSQSLQENRQTASNADIMFKAVASTRRNAFEYIGNAGLRQEIRGGPPAGATGTEFGGVDRRIFALIK